MIPFSVTVDTMLYTEMGKMYDCRRTSGLVGGNSEEKAVEFIWALPSYISSTDISHLLRFSLKKEYCQRMVQVSEFQEEMWRQTDSTILNPTMSHKKPEVTGFTKIFRQYYDLYEISLTQKEDL